MTLKDDPSAKNIVVQSAKPLQPQGPGRLLALTCSPLMAVSVSPSCRLLLEIPHETDTYW